MRRVLLIALVFGLLDSAVAEAMDGNKLFEGCRQQYRVGLSGYVAGVWDKAGSDAVTATVYLAMQDRKKSEHMDKMLMDGMNAACLPQGVTNGQMVDVICKFLRDNPAERHKLGSDLTMNALVTAFPCEKR
jgi:hypothetical protein